MKNKSKHLYISSDIIWGLWHVLCQWWERMQESTLELVTVAQNEQEKVSDVELVAQEANDNLLSSTEAAEYIDPVSADYLRLSRNICGGVLFQKTLNEDHHIKDTPFNP